MFGASAITVATTAQHLREHVGHRRPDAGLLPSTVATIHTVPLSAAARHLTPGRLTAEVPHDAVDHQAVVARRPSFATTLRRQERLDQRPFRTRPNRPP